MTPFAFATRARENACALRKRGLDEDAAEWDRFANDLMRRFDSRPPEVQAFPEGYAHSSKGRRFMAVRRRARTPA